MLMEGFIGLYTPNYLLTMCFAEVKNYSPDKSTITAYKRCIIAYNLWEFGYIKYAGRWLYNFFENFYQKIWKLSRFCVTFAVY